MFPCEDKVVFVTCSRVTISCEFEPPRWGGTGNYFQNNWLDSIGYCVADNLSEFTLEKGRTVLTYDRVEVFTCESPGFRMLHVRDGVFQPAADNYYPWQDAEIVYLLPVSRTLTTPPSLLLLSRGRLVEEDSVEAAIADLHDLPSRELDIRRIS